VFDSFLGAFFRSLTTRGFGEGDGEGEVLCEGDAVAAIGPAAFAFAV
jgi:hypothetical protein